MINLIDTIRKNLQYPELQKVDPNTQEVRNRQENGGVDQLGQSAIPAVLTGLYKLSRNDEGCLKIMNTSDTGDSLAIIFNGQKEEVVEKISHYAGVSTSQAKSHLENIADESIRVLKTLTRDSTTELKHFMNDQRHDILVYLPASLKMGDLLNDEQLDDKTNKMEGPVSNIVHKIGNKLSQGGE